MRAQRIDWSRVFLGDWNRVVRDPIDLLRIPFPALAVVLVVLGRTTAIGMVAASIAVVVARLLDLPRLYDLGTLVALMLVAWGTAFNLYGRVHDYDKIVHFGAPLVYAPIVYILLIRAGLLVPLHDTRRAHHGAAIVLVTLALGTLISVGYEIVEFTADHAFGAHLQKGNTDTMTDLIAGVLGSLAGGLLLVAWARFGWGTVRRIPGDRVASRTR